MSASAPTSAADAVAHPAPVAGPASDGPRSATLSEAASKQLLAGYGVPVPGERLVSSPGEAGAAASEIGFPVVVKLCGEGIAHKTERGLVRLRLGDPAAVEAAAADLLAAATAEDGAVAVLVAPMIAGSRELIAGLNRDAQFGATVMIGIGGVFAEAISDVALRLVPIDDVTARDMLADLSTQALLGRWRGEPAVDLDAVVGILRGLSQLAVEHPEVTSVDINPLIISAGRPVAVDALVEVTR